MDHHLSHKRPAESGNSPTSSLVKRTNMGLGKMILDNLDDDALDRDVEERLDRAELTPLINLPRPSMIGLSNLLNQIVKISSNILDQKFLDNAVATELIKTHRELETLLKSAFDKKQYGEIRRLALLQAVDRPKEHLSVPDHTKQASGQQKDAVVKSWGYKYSGEAAQLLWEHIKLFHNRSPEIYANYAAIVQSSGMGKSRTVDELGKYHFVIPINLRGPHSTGYPPPDHEVRDFLSNAASQAAVYDRACAFMEALFNHTAEKVRDLLQELESGRPRPEDVAQQFRANMTSGTSFDSVNTYRKKFYNYIIQKAQDIVSQAGEKTSEYKEVYKRTSPRAEDSYDNPVVQACSQLVAALRGEDTGSPSPSPHQTTKKKKKSKENDENPSIILAFDEAHTLTESARSEPTPWTNFSELRHVLRTLKPVSVFSLFMSTTGKISQFTPASEDDTSARLRKGELVLIQPFTDVGFDTLARKITPNGDWDLQKVTTIDHMAHLGRPLFGSLYDAGDKSVRDDIVAFAAEKLLNASYGKNKTLDNGQTLACLSQRIPLEFNSTNFTSSADEKKQVEGHMRVCLKIDTAFESMVTVSASEPLLSEAAFIIMSEKETSVPQALKSVMDGFSINKGDRGEYLVLSLFTIARDNAIRRAAKGNLRSASRILSVTSFLSNLFRRQTGRKGICSDFAKAKMHFSHYIKVHDYKVIDAECLLLLASRGAAILCANNQSGIDTINPFLYEDLKLVLKNLGLIITQIKNDPKFTDKPKKYLFAAMDPYSLGILRESDDPVPIIKIVFALAAKTPSLHVTRCKPTPEYNAITYEIWCSGISPDVIGAIKKSDGDIWAALLQASYGWQTIYEDEDLRRTMNPGAASDSGHWSRWIDIDLRLHSMP